MERQTHLYDANNKVLGRLSTEVARVLTGKGKVDYTPHIDDGDAVVIINAKQIHVTGNKEKDKRYYRYSGYPGGMRTATVEEMREKDARKILQHAIHGMLPKNKLGRQMQKRLFVYNDANHDKKIDVTHA